MTDIWKTGVLLLLVVAIVPALGVAWSDHSRSQYAVTDESIVVDYNQSVPVDVEAVRYGTNVTLTTNSGNDLTDAEYDWNSSTGEVTFYDSAEINDGETVWIDYSYFERSDVTGLAGGVVNPWGTILPWMLVVGLAFGGYRFATSGGGGL